ncbi:MAG: adenylyltransferase/cytidyltransferase family protein [Thaumarchaeota archaeon]|nr:adenylyltransferase/cytidyltransferase family protein [Nitrososphaerota archaeon]
MKEFELLRAVYATMLRQGRSTIQDLEAETGESAHDIAEEVKRASGLSLVQVEPSGEVRLTPSGRSKLKVVMVGGAFEIIHPGHLHTMTEAKKLGNVLVAVVATDKSVLKNKGRDPVTPQDWRVRLVGSVRLVDVGLAGGQGSIYDTLERVRPDIVALGYDQVHNPVEIEIEAKKRGITVKVVRLDSPVPGVKTSKIISTM